MVYVHMKILSVKEMTTRHGEFVYVILSFFVILVIFVNSLMFNSPFIGTLASVVYILVNGNIIAGTFFKESKLKLPLGILLLIALLGVVGWVFMILYRLSIIEVTITLCIASSLSFIVSKYEKIRRFMRRKS